MNSYRLKDIAPAPGATAEVTALQWSGSNWHEMLAWAEWENDADASVDGNTLTIADEGETMEAAPGDWVLRDFSGRFSVQTEAYFADIYELLAVAPVTTEPIIEIPEDPQP